MFNPLSIIGWITGLPLGQIASDIASIQRSKIAAQTDKERLDHQEREDALRARMSVMVAEAGSRINSIVRATLSVPVIVYLWQTIIIDKIVCKWVFGVACRTDDLSQNQWTFVWIVVGFYFLHWTVGQVRK